ncbi:fumarylacetoacetate hydrolase [Usnea florida]
MPSSWTHLIRFIAQEDGQIHLGQVDPKTYPDLGIASVEKKKIVANLITGSVFDGTVTDKKMSVSQLLSPISVEETPIIRCLGLNYRDHAKEANMPIPTNPVLFVKPRAALCGPYPQKISVPKLCQDGSSDYEAELTIVIGKTGRDIPQEKALDYVLGYTCGNDVSARTQQFSSTQWSFSKGFDSSAPIGPVLVAPTHIPDPHALGIKAIHNGTVVQDSNTKEMIFSVAETIAFLSQGTTLERGSLIMTGTPPGIGAMREPKVVLSHGDDMRVEIEGIGTLVNEVYYE